MESIDLTTLDWLAAIGWTLIGIAFQKSWIYPHGVADFSLKKWLKENFFDVIRGLLLTLIVLKLGDIVFQLLSFTGIDFKGLAEKIREAGLDPVQTALVISIAAQYILYKRKKAKRQVQSITPPPGNPPNNDPDK